MTQTIKRGRMGVLDKIGQGGQGVVYRAASVRTTFAKSMVYKEYKPVVLASLNVAALEAMPEFLESLPYRDGARLISLAAWPCAVVEDAGRATGFVMPSIPDEFFTDFWTSNSSTPSKVAAEFQHLLNDPQVLAMRFAGNIISDRQRYELLRQVASALLFFHDRGVCVGDISPKNMLFSLSPSPAVYFIDFDGVRVNGISLSPQVETPGWHVPAGEENATVYSDRYKLGLLALRLLLGSQDANDPTRLPSSSPSELRKVITDTLTSAAQQRPNLATWDQALAGAIAAAPRPAPPPPRTAPQPMVTITPPSPTTLANPSTGPIRFSQPAPSTGPIPIPAPSRSIRVAWWLIPAALLLLPLLTFFAMTNHGGTGATNSPSTRAADGNNSRHGSLIPTVENIQLPPEAVFCSQAVGGAYPSAARGNNVTSCPFAEAVREQVNRTGSRFPRSVVAYSPVTQISYDMMCTGQVLITCTGGNNAVVYVY